MSETTTIVGVATGTPDGGVAVVRLSGPRALAIAEALGGRLPVPRQLGRRRLKLAADVPPEDGLLVAMPGPASFTGEDVVELHVHAGARNVARVVDACIAAGAQPAEAGEFTRRAFEHGRLTLDQAEGIAAIIAAKTDVALAQARRLASGELGRAVEFKRERLLALRAEVEANLDFPEDVEDGDRLRWAAEIEGLRAEVEAWLRRFEAGRRARERARVVLAGPPNAGKSSLFNALLGRRRALVSSVPGTTRDYVEAELEVGPYGCLLVDTAGLRSEAEAIEAEGIAFSRDQIEGADVVLWLEPSDTPPSDAEPEVSRAASTVIFIETKRDIGCARPSWHGVALGDGGGQGLDELRALLHAWFQADGDDAWIGLHRHSARAKEALAALERAAVEVQRDDESGMLALELLAFELDTSEQRLGEITGASRLGPVGEAVLEQIFSRFCIGK